MMLPVCCATPNNRWQRKSYALNRWHFRRLRHAMRNWSPVKIKATAFAGERPPFRFRRGEAR